MKGIAAALLVVIVISTCPPSLSLEVVSMLSDHRWECVSIALDHVVGVPLAWGVTSALRNAPGLASSLQMVGGSGGGVLVATCGPHVLWQTATLCPSESARRWRAILVRRAPRMMR